jgi:hypothetical protein
MGHKVDGFVKSPVTAFYVIPAKAGIQLFQHLVDSGVRRSDGTRHFLRVHQGSVSIKQVSMECATAMATVEMGYRQAASHIFNLFSTG